MEQQMLRILEMFSQPVFLAKDEKVVWRNSTARLLLMDGASLPLLLERAEPLFARWTREGVLHIPLVLGGMPYDATVTATDDGDLFVVSRRGDEAENTANAVISAAGSLRKTLHNLLTAAEELFQYTEAHSEAAAASARLNQAIYRLLRLANQMSESGQLLTHGRTARREPTNLKAFLDDFLYNARPLVESASLTLEYTPLPVPVHADADTGLLELALYNLLSNAMQYTPRGGTIRISAERQGRTVLFSVSDTGEGISPDVFPTLFTRFSAQKTGDARWGGGFGLPIVREIAQLHGGSMTVDSAGAQGTRVTFSVSLEPTVLCLHAPDLRYDNYNSFHHGLVELSDVLDAKLFDPQEV